MSVTSNKAIFDFARWKGRRGVASAVSALLQGTHGTPRRQQRVSRRKVRARFHATSIRFGGRPPPPPVQRLPSIASCNLGVISRDGFRQTREGERERGREREKRETREREGREREREGERGRKRGEREREEREIAECGVVPLHYPVCHLRAGRRHFSDEAAASPS